MSELTKLRAVDVDRLETVVVEALSNYQNKITTPATEETARLPAEVVLSNCEEAAKAVEGMRDEVKIHIKNLEASLVEADNNLKFVAETAAAIREQGKVVQVQIEKASNTFKQINDSCTEFLKKVNG